jgi:hypothetical protein
VKCNGLYVPEIRAFGPLITIHKSAYSGIVLMGYKAIGLKLLISAHIKKYIPPYTSLCKLITMIITIYCLDRIHNFCETISNRYIFSSTYREYNGEA